MDAVVRWIDACRVYGPPEDAVLIDVDDDRYAAVVPETELEGVSVSVVYRLIVDDRERLILVRDIG